MIPVDYRILLGGVAFLAAAAEVDLVLFVSSLGVEVMSLAGGPRFAGGPVHNAILGYIKASRTCHDTEILAEDDI